MVRTLDLDSTAAYSLAKRRKPRFSGNPVIAVLLMNLLAFPGLARDCPYRAWETEGDRKLCRRLKDAEERRDEITRQHSAVMSRRDALGRKDPRYSAATSILSELTKLREEHVSHIALLESKVIYFDFAYEGRRKKEADAFAGLKSKVNQYLTSTSATAEGMRRDAEQSQASAQNSKVAQLVQEIETWASKLKAALDGLTRLSDWVRSAQSLHGLGGLKGKRDNGSDLRAKVQQLAKCGLTLEPSVIGGAYSNPRGGPDIAPILSRARSDFSRVQQNLGGNFPGERFTVELTPERLEPVLAQVKLDQQFASSNLEALTPAAKTYVSTELLPALECFGSDVSELYDDDSLEHWMSRDLSRVKTIAQFQRGLIAFAAEITSLQRQVNRTMSGLSFTAAARRQQRQKLTAKLLSYQGRLGEIKAAMQAL